MPNLFLGMTTLALTTGVLATTATADVVLSGPTSNAGTYSTSALQAFAASNPTDDVSYNGFAGVSLWGLLGGSAGITTTTLPGDNSKNAILRYYIIGSSSSSTSVVSAVRSTRRSAVHRRRPHSSPTRRTAAIWLSRN